MDKFLQNYISDIKFDLSHENLRLQQQRMTKIIKFDFSILSRLSRDFWQIAFPGEEYIGVIGN